MTANQMTRRAAMTGLGATLLGLALPRHAFAGSRITVLKDPDCGCCSAWINVLRRHGFDVAARDTDNASLSRYKRAQGIPDNMTSCHTGQVAGYMIEGHVPPADIRRLLDTRPDALGLAVPGMPYGSPGMGPESERDAYTVFLMRHDGSVEPFAHYPAA